MYLFGGDTLSTDRIHVTVLGAHNVQRKTYTHVD